MFGDPKGKITSYGAGRKSINLSEWPVWDSKLIEDREAKIAVQINGRVRAEMLVQTEEGEEAIKDQALNNPAILKYLGGKTPQRVIYVKGRLINIVL